MSEAKTMLESAKAAFERSRTVVALARKRVDGTVTDHLLSKAVDGMDSGIKVLDDLLEASTDVLEV